MGTVEVVGEAANGNDAIRLARDLRPDIVFLDIAMPLLGGLPALHRIIVEGLPTKVVMLSMHDSDEYVLEAVRGGAAGYICKDAVVEELAFAVQAVARGGSYLSPNVSRKLSKAFVTGTPRSGTALTARQTEILSLIARGRSSKEAARELSLSVKTIETHRTQIMDRVGIRDLAGLVRYAVRTGVVSPED